jgi:hypothetical protein
MGGGLLQLVAYGAQDAYLSGNPQITFWRGLFKRHTNFAMEPFRVNLTGQASWGTKHSAILGRHADLVGPAYIEVELVDEPLTLVYGSADGARGGFNLVEYVELDIGGQVIDRQYGEFLNIWSNLTSSRMAMEKLNRMCKTNDSPNNPCSTYGRPSRNNLTYIPLLFWFCRNPGAALPLIALQYHEVKINILWNKPSLIFEASRPSGSVVSSGPAQANLLVDYIYLDVEERRRMAQESHEYLIEQTQFNEDKGLTTAQNRIDLTFNHPVKELIWVTQLAGRKDCRINNGGDIGPLDYDNIIYECALQLNGQDRMQALPGLYFNTVQPFQHHTGDAGSQLTVNDADRGIYVYSFAIKPEEHQPSGTCNFSRIDTATLVFSVDGSRLINNLENNNYNIRVYAINYNILRIMSGMGGLAYSN